MIAIALFNAWNFHGILPSHHDSSCVAVAPEPVQTKHECAMGVKWFHLWQSHMTAFPPPLTLGPGVTVSFPDQSGNETTIDAENRNCCL